MAGVVDLISGYPEFLIARALDVRVGWPAKFKFCPSIAEMREWLETEIQPARYALEWERGAQQQLLAGPVQPKPTLEQLKAKHGENWGLGSNERKQENSFLSVGDLVKKYGVSHETIDAIPEGKK